MKLLGMLGAMQAILKADQHWTRKGMETQLHAGELFRDSKLRGRDTVIERGMQPGEWKLRVRQGPMWLVAESGKVE